MRWRAVAGHVSAALALPFGLGSCALVLLQLLQWGGGLDGSTLLIAALLLVGAIATFRRAAWGRTMLAAGWGCLFGAFAGTYLRSALMTAIDASWGQGSYSVDLGWLTALLISIPVAALIGMALALFHKEPT